MEFSQGQIIQKPNKQDVSSLFMTHRLNVMHAPVKFHNYIFRMVKELWPGHGLLYGTKSRADNSKNQTSKSCLLFSRHIVSMSCMHL